MCFQEFFLNIKSILNTGSGFNVRESHAFTKWGKSELQLDEKLFDEKMAVHKALCGEYWKLEAMFTQKNSLM